MLIKYQIVLESNHILIVEAYIRIAPDNLTGGHFLCDSFNLKSKNQKLT